VKLPSFKYVERSIFLLNQVAFTELRQRAWRKTDQESDDRRHYADRDRAPVHDGLMRHRTLLSYATARGAPLLV
jgi:hypothetical protein